MSAPKITIVHKGQASAKNGILRVKLMSSNLDYILISTIHNSVGSALNNVSYILYHKGQVHTKPEGPKNDKDKILAMVSHYYNVVDDHGSLYKFIVCQGCRDLFTGTITKGNIKLQKLISGKWKLICRIDIDEQAFFEGLSSDLTRLCYTTVVGFDTGIWLYSITEKKIKYGNMRKTLDGSGFPCIISSSVNTTVLLPLAGTPTYSIINLIPGKIEQAKVPHPYKLETLRVSNSGQTILEITTKFIRFLTVDGKVISTANYVGIYVLLCFNDKYLLTADNNNILVWPIHNLSFNVAPLRTIKLEELYVEELYVEELDKIQSTIGQMTMYGGPDDIFLLVVDRLDGAKHILDWFKLTID